MDQLKAEESQVRATAAASPRGDEALSRADWIEAATALLAARGIGAVKITRLADDLKVTRGSFYWHFKDRADLLAAMIEVWEQRNTKALLDAIAGTCDLVSGILATFECWMAGEPFAPRLDAAMRDWGHHSAKVRQAVKRADDKRIGAIAGVFLRAGFPAQEAEVRARAIYYTQVGYYALEEDESITKRNTRLAAYFKVFTGLDLDADSVAAFHRRTQEHRAAGASVTANAEQHHDK